MLPVRRYAILRLRGTIARYRGPISEDLILRSDFSGIAFMKC